jgi:hypothetical protein
MDNAFTFLRYVGTDVDAFFQAFPLAEVVKGERIPTGQRGVLVGKQYAEEWLKLKNARRLDQIKDARDRRGKRIAEDEELQRWVRENRAGIREILLQLDPARADALAGLLRPALGAPAGEGLAPLLARLFATNDESFDRATRCSTTRSPRACACTGSTSATPSPSAPSKNHFSSVT